MVVECRLISSPVVLAEGNRADEVLRGAGAEQKLRLLLDS